MEFYDGFSWAVPKAFKDAIASCAFEEGDTLYSTKTAYGTRAEVVDKIDHAIYKYIFQHAIVEKIRQ